MIRAGVVLVVAYLIGSIPFSYLVARWWGVADVRSVGSGNVGATNVMRSAGRTAGIIALLLDASKGAVAAAAAERLAPDTSLPAFAAVAAILGHMYPIWLSFRGGKGVATGVGAFCPLAPWAAAGGIVAFVITAAAFRYASLGSCLGAAVLAGLTFVTGATTAICWCATASAALVIWKHRANLRRIAAGIEPRLGRAKG